MSADWRLKLLALLHDPPDKVLGLPGHEDRGLATAERLIGVAPSERDFQLVKAADAIASAMDRAAFDKTIKISSDEFKRLPQVRHPLSGRPHSLNLHPARRPQMASEIDGVFSATGDLRRKYLWLWRRLPDQLKRLPGLKQDWLLLPADTRAVNHTIWDHISATSAVVSALPQPALLIFSIGPVQQFIRTARRTQDLWMGSYILSYLAWQGMQVIAEEFGPDSIMYPNLRGQPLADVWLNRDNIVDRPEDLSRATLPNKFVALLPVADVTRMAEMAEAEVRKAWKRLGDETKGFLDTHGVVVDDLWKETFRKQCERFSEFHWCSYRWLEITPERRLHVANAALAQVEQLLQPGPDDDFRRTYDTFTATASEMVNIGTVYSRLYDVTHRAFESGKTLRPFDQFEEIGEKCTVCGVRSALRTQAEDARAHWKDVAERLRKDAPGQYVTVKSEGRERLCGVCLIKRLAQIAFFRDEFSLWGGFPSTSSVAAASFKRGIIQNLNDPDLQKAVLVHLARLKSLGVNAFAEKTAKAMLPQLAERCPKEFFDLLRYDGALFYYEAFTPERFESDYGLIRDDRDLEPARVSLLALYASCRELGIGPPAKYYAVLMLDGDQMGKWLAGDKAPLFRHALHDKAVKCLNEKHAVWTALLDVRRPLSPALHSAMSAALADFALQLAPYVIEKRYCGRLVYAGGDDVLALIPLDDALPAARELRALFSGEADLKGDRNKPELTVNLRDSKKTGFVTYRDDLLTTMGPAASASIGIAIAHHLSPLDSALAAARHAQASAKEQYGRNAVAVHFLKRSGEELRAGAQWFYSVQPSKSEDEDSVGLLLGLQKSFGQKKISMGFAHDFFDAARTLAGVPEAIQSEMRRLISRRAQADSPELKKLAAGLAALAQSLDRHASPDPKQDQPQRGPVELGKWLLLMRFLAQGGVAE